MTTPKYQLGDQLWRTTWDSTPDYVECPECGGHGRIRCIMADDTIVSVECRGCQAGYDPPSGRVRVHKRSPKVEWCRVTGVEIASDKIEYRVTDGTYTWVHNEADLYVEKPDAETSARTMAERADLEERERIAHKEKDGRSWSWNAHYHRDCIRRAQRDLEYHTAKLAVASVKAKEDRAPGSAGRKA